METRKATILIEASNAEEIDRAEKLIARLMDILPCVRKIDIEVVGG